MQKRIAEDWEFTITVTSAKPCRLGYEAGDHFVCQYGCPADFCPKTMHILYTLCEIQRCGGNYTLRGSSSPDEIDFPCADGCVLFHLVAKRIRA